MMDLHFVKERILNKFRKRPGVETDNMIKWMAKKDDDIRKIGKYDMTDIFLAEADYTNAMSSIGKTVYHDDLVKHTRESVPAAAKISDEILLKIFDLELDYLIGIGVAKRT